MTVDVPTAAPVLAEVVRSGFVEGRHRGALVVLDADGSVRRALGDIASPVYPRSSSKPMQAAAALRAGAGLSGPRLALAAASHAGEEFHQRLVHELLADAGLDETALGCPPDLPLDRPAAEAQLAAGHGRTRTAMNCSGKHAGMLTACVAAGWSTHDYLDPGHPLQLLIRESVEAATGEPVAHTGTDGCGAPLLAYSLTGLARAFRAHVLAAPGTPERRVADAMRAHPEYVAGTRQTDTAVMRAVPGALAKAGAEGVQAVALPDGRALAFKIEDGGARARGPVLAAVLAGLGAGSAELARATGSPLLGGGRPVGEVRAVI
ncbi:asparaginase [Streptomyces aidingensis]|uniref:Asparaginase n=1 Tax=Streptomyces aidingensis TaxID=910347 RepID=A0A1I1HRF1_9ACTN|nr:asparaginase [Streptomyces aidingensis]SFC26395.1 asparaginase [Streptomyces aidingensis]